VLGLKDNQPTLTEAAERLLAKAPVVHETHDKGHGRTEHRYLRVAKVSAALAAQLGFPSASQFIAVDRERGDLADRMTSMETSYYVTDLREDQASPAKLACYFRGHWGIENRSVTTCATGPSTRTAPRYVSAALPRSSRRSATSRSRSFASTGSRTSPSVFAGSPGTTTGVSLSWACSPDNQLSLQL
jgi:hypothetical protein